MVISLIGSIPLFLEAASEILENKMGMVGEVLLRLGPLTYGKVFLSNKKRLALRLAENVILSLIAYFFPRFTDILDLNILTILT